MNRNYAYNIDRMRLLQKTSVSLLLPAVIAVLYNQWYNAIIYGSMCITSINHHTKYTKTSLFIDRTMLTIYTGRLIYITYSDYVFLTIVILSYSYLFYSYIYGYYNKCCAFHVDRSKGEKYHAVNHYIGCIIPTIFIILNKTC